jgi:hypothetical protein
MDGRNLSKNVILKWSKDISLIDVINSIPLFIKKVITAKSYDFYGEFCLNSVYNLKNYNNMLVNTFKCHIDSDIDSSKMKKVPLFFNDKSGYFLVVSDDCLILFKQLEPEGEINFFGKIVFWALLFSITDIQINKDKKVVKINFFDNDRDNEVLRLQISNVLYFKETIIKKMSNLRIKSEISQLVKGNYIENKITSKDINNMSIEELEKYIEIFKHKIENNLANYYVVDTFSLLSGKAIEYYSKEDPEKQIVLLKQMKTILKQEKVQSILNNNKKSDEEINKENDIDNK